MLLGFLWDTHFAKVLPKISSVPFLDRIKVVVSKHKSVFRIKVVSKHRSVFRRWVVS